MGKRARISKNDLPNQERVMLLKKLEMVFDKHMQMAELRKNAKTEEERQQISRVLNGLRQTSSGLFEELKMIDFVCQRELEALFNNYCESNNNVYHGLRLKNNVSEKIQTEEIKKITHLIHTVHTEEDRVKLQQYIDNKPQSELNALITLTVRNYQKQRSDFSRQKANSFLAYFHKKIECKPYTHATEDEIRATRTDFNGFFNIPSLEQLKKYNPYSEAYQRFRANRNKGKQHYSMGMYNLDKCPAWQACEKTSVLNQMKIPLYEALVQQGVPPEMLKDMKVADFGSLLFDTFGKEKYNPARGNKLSFEDILPGIDSRHKTFFWKNNALPTVESRKKFTESLLRRGVSQAYIDVLIPSILNEGQPNPKVRRNQFKGVIPYFTVHHKWAIQYLGGSANNQKNYVGIAEFKDNDDSSKETPQHDVWQVADGVIRKAQGQLASGDQLYGEVRRGNEQAEDFIEYMVDTRYDNQNDGKYWTISMGYKPEDNIRNEVKDFVALRTKAQSEVKKGRRIDQGYRPAAFAR